MQNISKSQHNALNDIFTHPSEALKAMMSIHINTGESILALSEQEGCIDSQEFMDWQDRLNAISVQYE